MTPRRLLGSLWLLSWFELYLEIFRHHHAPPALLLHPVRWFSSGPDGARPGDWLLAVLVFSTLAPIAFGIAAAWMRFGPVQTLVRSDAVHPFPFPSAAVAFGALLIVLAVINQIVRHDPFTIDLTLREGNGGFIVLGSILVLFGLLLQRRRHIAQSAPH